MRFIELKSKDDNLILFINIEEIQTVSQEIVDDDEEYTSITLKGDEESCYDVIANAHDIIKSITPRKSLGENTIVVHYGQ